jgi:predicted AAA+ superfamily ATPase
MHKEELKSIIVDQSNRKCIPDQAISRDKYHELKKAAETPFILSVSGLRRSGKSTILHQLVAERRAPVYYLNFDDDRLIHFTIDDFQRLNESFYELFGSHGEYYFDEIQVIEGWEKYVRRLYDEGKKVFITGSNASLLSSELGTHLTGRNIQLELYPFSFKEYLDYKEIKVTTFSLYQTETKAMIQNQLNSYINDGGIPEYIKTQDPYYLHSLYENIIYRDIINRYSIKKEKLLKELVHYLISNLGKEFSYNSLKKVVSLSNAETVKEYIAYLNNSYMLQTLNRFDYSLKRQIQAPKKIYAIDIALGQSVSFSFSENLGRKIENLVYLQLKRQGHHLFYHHVDKECDFIINDRGKITSALQVTVSLDEPVTRQREIEGLYDALSNYNLDEGVIITMHEEDEIEYQNKKIVITPLWKWLLN